MCGIAGFVHRDRLRDASYERLERMTNAIVHRGPDGEGYHVSGNVALGHRRLSIIDLELGAQPMYSEDRSVVLVYNGEIYNYVELRSELKTLGAKFYTQSDTEVLLRAYQEWGIDCLRRFNGMWAFALFDANTQDLLLARDRVGEKPCLYTICDDTLFFASESKCFNAIGISMEPNLEMMELYLVLGYIPAPHTFYKGVHKLRPGHYLRFNGTSCLEHRYWSLPNLRESDMIVDAKYVDREFKELLSDSVRIRMRSDVKYGAFLSGGLDSSTIVAIMARQSGFPVETFTIGYDESSFDESARARLVATRYSTSHHEERVYPDSIDSSVERVIKYFDEPFGDPSAMPMGLVARIASPIVKMVLTGDGGDEVLSGYTSYQGEKFASHFRYLPRYIQTLLPGLLLYSAKMFSGPVRYSMNRVHKVVMSSSMSFLDRLLVKSSWGDVDLVNQLMAGYPHHYEIRDFLSDSLAGCQQSDGFYQNMHFQFSVSLPDDMLAKVDRMTMAYSMEARTPFLDHRLVELMATVHKNVKMARYQRKTVLRRTFGRELDRKVLNGSKRGFNVPLVSWFAGRQLDQQLHEVAHGLSSILNPLGLRKATQEMREGIANHGNFLWLLLVLNRWLSGLPGGDGNH